MMVDDIRPETNIEWLWTPDHVELSWEILRYRRLKKKILDAHRIVALEAILQRLDVPRCLFRRESYLICSINSWTAAQRRRVGLLREISVRHRGPAKAGELASHEHQVATGSIWFPVDGRPDSR